MQRTSPNTVFHQTPQTGTLLNWKTKRILNKVTSNKRRQNPTRQAAVRSFKRFHFSNQDFLMRKYLRSLKKEPLKPKLTNTIKVQSEVLGNAVSTITSNNLQNVALNSSAVNAPISIPVATGSRVYSGPSLQANASSSFVTKREGTISKGSPSNIPGRSNKRTQHPELLVGALPNPVDIGRDIKFSRKKPWPINAHGLDRPTFESVQKEILSTMVFNEKLVDSVEDSLENIFQYVQSVKELSDFLNSDNENDEQHSKELKNNNIKRGEQLSRDDSEGDESDDAIDSCSGSPSSISTETCDSDLTVLPEQQNLDVVNLASDTLILNDNVYDFSEVISDPYLKQFFNSSKEEELVKMCSIQEENSVSVSSILNNEKSDILWCGSETITLYNQSTSCTLPYRTTSYHTSATPPQTVSCQTDGAVPPVNKKCKECNDADIELQKSFSETQDHLRELLLSTLQLKSLLTARSEAEVAEEVFNEI